MRNNAIIIGTALVALLVGGAGGYFAQNRTVATLSAERDAAQVEVTGLKTQVSTLESQVTNLQDQISGLNEELEQARREVQDLQAAVQVITSPRDVAVAYGRASLTRNHTWIRALMTPELAASYEFPAEIPDMKPRRYAIEQESEGQDSWTYVVRVWYDFKNQGEVGYSDSTLEVIRSGEFYKIRSLTVADYYSLQQGK